MCEIKCIQVLIFRFSESIKIQRRRRTVHLGQATPFSAVPFRSIGIVPQNLLLGQMSKCAVSICTLTLLWITELYKPLWSCLGFILSTQKELLISVTSISQSPFALAVVVCPSGSMTINDCPRPLTSVLLLSQVSMSIHLEWYHQAMLEGLPRS